MTVIAIRRPVVGLFALGLAAFSWIFLPGYLIAWLFAVISAPARSADQNHAVWTTLWVLSGVEIVLPALAIFLRTKRPIAAACFAAVPAIPILWVSLLFAREAVRRWS